MSTTSPPMRCVLCKARNGILPTKFRQVYPQKDLPPVFLEWWECQSCKSWFVHPVPSPEVVDRYWRTVNWADPKRETEIARAKTAIHTRMLEGLSRWAKPGPLLDFGCNFGQFLPMAREAGWHPYGFEPNGTAADSARLKGFDVRCAWSLQEAGFSEEYFAAITANDVLCLTWEPIATLQNFCRILRPGGVLAMRLTNKRFVLGLVRAFSAAGSRDERISRILQGQFHTISLTSLSRILRGIGFHRIQIHPHAMTAPWGSLGYRTKVAYLGAGVVYYLSFTMVNLSPGVLLFAQKRPDLHPVSVPRGESVPEDRRESHLVDPGQELSRQV